MGESPLVNVGSLAARIRVKGDEGTRLREEGMKGEVWMLTGVEMETRDLYPRRPTRKTRALVPRNLGHKRARLNPPKFEALQVPLNEAFASHVFRVRTFCPFQHLTPPQPWSLSHC